MKNVMTLAQKIDAAGGEPGYIPPHANDDTPPRPNLAGPFPNLRCREIVKDIVDAVVEVTTHCKVNPDQAYWFTLGIMRGARLVAQHDDDDDSTAERFVVELLKTLQRGGVDAVKELVEVVTGHELELTVAKAA